MAGLGFAFCLGVAASLSSSLPDSVRPCAPCHSGSDNDQVGEWLASPYSQPGGGQGCVDCHSSRCTGSGATTARPGRPGRAARLAVTAVCSADTVEAEVVVANLGAGHDLPTGPSGRTLVLEVSARREDGLALAPQPVSDHPAISSSSAGLAARVFVKHVQRGTSDIYRPRLAPFETDVSRHRFTGSGDEPAHVTTRLLLVPVSGGPLEIDKITSPCSKGGTP